MPDLTTLLQAAILGVVEGVTEFIPVSSTGHLILAGHLIGFEGAYAGVFEVVIQLGAILAVCVLYFERLLRVVLRLPYDPAARRFVAAILAAFLPSVVLGALFHDVIKGVLFSPWVVVASLILGGLAILAIEAMSPAPRQHEAEALPVPLALKIGLCQVVSMIPGVSRSGATILGAVVLGVDRKAAAEFSFFLAIPTMLAAAVYDLYKNGSTLSGGDLLVIAVGFAVSLVTAVIVIRAFLAFLVRHTFCAFGWYRIGAGLVMALILLVEGPAQEPSMTSPPEPAALAPAEAGSRRSTIEAGSPSEVRVESSVGLSTSRRSEPPASRVTGTDTAVAPPPGAPPVPTPATSPAESNRIALSAPAGSIRSVASEQESVSPWRAVTRPAVTSTSALVRLAAA